MSPILGAHTVSSPVPLPGTSSEVTNPLERKLSRSLSIKTNASRASSTGSIPFGDVEVEVITVEGLPHAYTKLDARKYKTPQFRESLLDVLLAIPVTSWLDDEITPDLVKIEKVAGSLTNAVFFVSCPSIPKARTLLLRIYGPSSGALINRARELYTLHVLSSQYRIGPRIYGTFENGRIEEYFDSTALTASELRDPRISRYIGARMAELHCVDIEAVEQTTPETRGEGRGWEVAAKKNFRTWLPAARDVLELPSVTAETRAELDLDVLKDRWITYIQWLDQFEREEGPSKRVFAHNDTQYGNLLRLTKPKEGIPEHRQVCSCCPADDFTQIIVVDFEYAAPNSAAFDIANHFHEWTANYHGSTPHLLDHTRYPTLEQRRNFYATYLEHSCPPLPSSEQACIPLTGSDLEKEMQKLEEQVRAWSPASHAMWTVWGIVQARDDMERNDGQAEFNYIGYAQCRLEGFHRELQALGL
ncbi:choline kinase cytoplasm [Punctularia strigosozonata HHB-11173 SS5]|uniref:choline kinase cytoplasm n=1 Tax=Punctularia strigosozonata (strain HHB-11173) TaxID=741275 RepID=UPI00044179C2|nr:choline kinase cytoplasm [Punctularia strigosozonata HHB-11173 SS5]EIN13633.1 choline kinase cytoplasm [Punctularia strigosozonata HHB-11173 SS5]